MATMTRRASIGGFLVWFCRFGTKALYWGFFCLFLINTVLVLVCFAFDRLCQCIECIGDWFSLPSLPAT